MAYGNRARSRIHQIERIASAPLVVAVALVVLIVAVRAAWGVSAKVGVVRDRLAQAESAQAELEARREDLAAKVQYLGSEQGIEAEIRTKYRAVREGESVAVIVDDSPDGSTADATGRDQGASSTPSVGWWRRLLQTVGL